MRIVFALFAAAVGCHKEPEVEPLTVDELRDPASCVECHPTHHEQWSGSMHAYASEDPVFRAMNAQGQRETDGALGDFCVKCHAPAAVALGLTTDGLNLDDVPEAQRGVTCWFCHQVDALGADAHNNPLEVADDDQFRGPIADPVETPAHRSVYAPTHDRDDLQSSALCGSCHDIVTPLGGHIERTYAEWQASLFAKPVFGLTCAGCHLPGSDGLAAEADGVKLRRIHDHAMPGVDLALTEFPGRDAQQALVQELLDDTVNAYLCVSTPAETTLAVVTLENVAAGHLFPSGAAADRRMWVELVAYQGGTVIDQSGVIPLGEDVSAVTDDEDPDLWRLWSTLIDPLGEPTHKFWEAQDLDVGELLVVQTTLDPSDPAYVSTHRTRNYLVRGGVPDRITVAVHLEPIGREILDGLVDSGDLDPAVRDAMPRFTLGPTVLEWTPAVPVNAGSLACVPKPPPATGGSTTSTGSTP
ncbi:MAG: multiheme c-type cytochrome [Myxococcota bacterium]